MKIIDDGVGIPAADFKAGSHGLASMRHRAVALGGTVDIRREKNGGTVVTVQIPAANAVQSIPEQAIP
jgi:signal transduction histidine kinase